MIGTDTTIIAVIGEIACGKDTLGYKLLEFAAKEKSVTGEIYSTTDKIDEVLNVLGYDTNRHNRQQLAINLLQYDSNVFTHALSKTIEVNKPGLAIINSVRDEAQIESWRKLVPKVYVVYIDVKEAVRLERYNKRLKDGESALDLGDFRKLHSAKTDKDLGRLKNLADFIVDNNGSVEELEQQAWDIINKI